MFVIRIPETLPSGAETADPASLVLVTKEAEKATAEASLLRLKEINAMDKTFEFILKEKVVQISACHQTWASVIKRGICLSLGAVMIVILLLILLL
jgi:hypothetical protein